MEIMKSMRWPAKDSEQLNFNEPGDQADLTRIDSLYLSGLDQTRDVWGIAEMRLLVAESYQPRDMSILLFGDVEVTNAVEPRITIEARIANANYVNLRNYPDVNSLTLGAADTETVFKALGRLEDSSWYRVEEIETGRIAWISGNYIASVDASDDLSLLAVEEPDAIYFGPMQAFYFESDSSGTCGQFNSDGLIIQTPEGVARVSLLINEVTVELVSGTTGGTAFIQSNTVGGMEVNVLSGSANVSTSSGGVTVYPGSQTVIPVTTSTDGVTSAPAPSAVPSNPQPIPGVEDFTPDAVASVIPVITIVESVTGVEVVNPLPVAVQPDTTSNSGNNGTAPGQTDNTSGNNPGQTNNSSSNSNGNSGNAPGQSGENPGNGGTPPGVRIWYATRSIW